MAVLSFYRCAALTKAKHCLQLIVTYFTDISANPSSSFNEASPAESPDPAKFSFATGAPFEEATPSGDNPTTTNSSDPSSLQHERSESNTITSESNSNSFACCEPDSTYDKKDYQLEEEITNTTSNSGLVGDDGESND